MRVTHRMVSETVGYNLQQGLLRLERFAGQLSTGKLIQKPSQDPAGVSKVMHYNTAIKRNEQFRKNMNEALGWLNTTESALMDVVETLQEVRTHIISGASDTVSAQDRKVIATIVEELQGHLLSLANTDYNGLYIFAGHQTTQRPYRFDGEGQLVYHGDQGRRVMEISLNQAMTVNITGEQVFAGTGLFEAVTSAHRALIENDQAALGGEALEKIDFFIDLTLQSLSEVGARVKSIETMRSTLDNENLLLRELLSQVQDIDFAYTVTEYQLQENTYRAALATAARMLQPSLVDYLR